MLQHTRSWWRGRSRLRPSSVDFSLFSTSAEPVCIVGAGPVGLCLSLLLAEQGVRSTILERRPVLFGDAHGTSSARSSTSLPRDGASNGPPHPRAHVLNARTMEIFRAMGLESDVRSLAPPSDQWSDFRYCTSLVGSNDFAVDRHLSSSRPRACNLMQHTPSFITHVSQPLLEALLLDKVRQLPDIIDLRLGVEVQDVIFAEERDNQSLAPSRATIVYQERQSVSSSETSSAKCQLESRFICATDGAASRVRQAAGISLNGEKALEKFASVHFTSQQLSPMVDPDNRGAMLYFVMNPSIIACVVAHDIEAGSWVAQVPVFPPYTASTGNENDPVWRKYCEEAIDACIGLPGIDRTIHSSRVWSMDMLCADTFAVEREGSWVFLAGDSAHQLPPSGGFGLNTGIQDAHNLAWKLARVLTLAAAEKEGKDLLHSYTQERRPIALDNLKVSKDNYLRGLSAPKAIGLNRELIAFASSALDNPIASALLPSSMRARLLETGASAGRTALLGAPMRDFASNRIEKVVASGEALPLLFPAHDIGYAYNSESFEAAEGRERFQEPASLYVPSVQSGSRFPHVWLRKKSGSGKIISSLDLVDMQGYVLFVTPEHAGMASSGEVSLVVCTKDFEVVSLKEMLDESGEDHGHAKVAKNNAAVWEDEDLCTLEAAWSSLWGAAEGSLLVRPDGHVV